MLDFPPSIGHREVAKLLQAEGWFSPKTTVYYIEIASGVSVKRAWRVRFSGSLQREEATLLSGQRLEMALDD
jgi:hypothetical protein